MSNSFMNVVNQMNNQTYTQNGARAEKSLNNAVYDMFAVGGAYRHRSDDDCIFLFKKALESDPVLALKCLFYLRDCRGGQGERRFFRVCFHWLCDNHAHTAARLLEQVSEYGRWDDLIYTTYGTRLWYHAMGIVEKQFKLDLECKTPSLLAKWMPSENASAKLTKEIAGEIRAYLGLNHKEYRKSLSILRERINVLERLMSANEWDKIEFDKIPSRAGLIYKNAFARRDIIAKRYETFMKSEDTKVNASVLYPYEIVEKAIAGIHWKSWYGGGMEVTLSDVDRAALEKYWQNLPDYFEGKPASMMCVVDTSGSMHGTPINVAISLGMYCAERIGGPFKDHYISFASRPQFIKVEGVDFADKVRRIYETNLCDNTNLKATFDLVKSMALRSDVKPEDIPETLVVISDMQIDHMSEWHENNIEVAMQIVRREWEAAGLKMPRLVYWNVNAFGDANIIDKGPDVSFVSGFSPVIFKSVLTGKSGWDLCLSTLLSERYDPIH